MKRENRLRVGQREKVLILFVLEQCDNQVSISNTTYVSSST
jgi:hypothetical protein